MKMSKIPVVLFRTALVISVTAVGAKAFTGDVAVDFVGPDVAVQLDPMDVGLPVQAPGGTVSGWEFTAVLFELDAANDMLRVGLDYVGHAGDADGDGDPSNSSAWLLGNGGFDFANLGGTESICIAFDFDSDMNMDVIAGVSAMTDTYSVNAFNNGGLLPFSFGAPMPMHQGAYMIGPDFELELTNLSGLADYTNMDEYCFYYSVFSGSYADDGIGEDFKFGEVCLDNRSADAQEVAGDFGLAAAYPNPFNPTTTLSFQTPETGMANLSVYNLAGRKVATLVDGMVDAGNHEVVFDASNLSSGVYFYTLRTANLVETRKMVLTK